MAVLGAMVLVVAPISSQTSQPRALVRPLECPKGDYPLLQGAPQTTGMRSGFVRLKPGESVGWHTTGQNEESLVVLRGEGAALIEGHQLGEHSTVFALVDNLFNYQYEYLPGCPMPGINAAGGFTLKF